MAGEIERLDFRIEDWAGRDRAWEWMGYEQILPDPDQVMERKGYSTYEWIKVLKFLLTDPHVWACYQSRRSGTLSQEWEIEQGTGAGAAKAQKLINEWLDGVDVYGIIGDILDAPFFGMRPIEVIWKAGNGRWLPDRVVGRPVEWFVFDLENQVRFLSKGNMIQGELPPDYKILLPQHNSSYENPYGERVIVSVFLAGGLEAEQPRSSGLYSPRNTACPFRWARCPRARVKTERAAILSKLVAMIQDAVAVSQRR